MTSQYAPNYVTLLALATHGSPWGYFLVTQDRKEVDLPIIILSLAQSKSFIVTASFPSAEPRRAAWLTRLARSAPNKPHKKTWCNMMSSHTTLPLNPDVVLATVSRFTSETCNGWGKHGCYTATVQKPTVTNRVTIAIEIHKWVAKNKIGCLLQCT